MKNVLITYILITIIGTICLLVHISRQYRKMEELQMTMHLDRIELLRLKTCMAYLYMDDIVEKKDGKGVEIIWFKKP